MIQSGITNGVRGEAFIFFLKSVVSLTGLRDIDVILCPEGIDLYDQAFTHRTVDSVRNYEFYEFLGDSTVNKSIAWYLAGRFPHLHCPGGIKILTRLKSNLVSKKSLASLARQLSFWEFVSASTDVRSMKMDKTLEDIFEAFIAVTEILVDRYLEPGAGFVVCHRLISCLLDRRDISLRYEDLFDAKTRIKEIFDFFGTKLGSLSYEFLLIDRVHYVTAILKTGDGRKFILGEGDAIIKVDAEQKASEKAIAQLKSMGYEKPIGEEYKNYLD